MSLKGNLVGFSLTEILQMIGMTKKSGCLTVVGGSAEGKIFFRDGTVFFAATPQNRIPIGIRLVDAGLLASDQLKEALRIQSKEHGRRRLGEILIGMKALDPDKLERFIQEQILDGLYEIFQWTDGTYFFSPEEAADDEDIGVYLDIDTVLVESHKRMDEWAKIREILPSLNVVLEMSAEPPADEIILSREEWGILRQLSAQPTPEMLRDHLHLTSLTICRTLARMMESNLIGFSENPPPIAVVLSHEEEPEEEDGEEEGNGADGQPRTAKYVKAGGGEDENGYKDLPVEWRSYYQKLEERLFNKVNEEKESA